MDCLKIAYIMTGIEFGGSEKVSLTFLKNVNRDRFNIYPIVLIRPWEEESFFVQELKDAGYSIFEIPVAVRPRSESRDYFRILRCFKILHGILRSDSFDLVHTHGYFADILGIVTAKVLGISVISTCHGFISNDSKLGIYNRLDLISLRFSGKIIAVSEEIKCTLVASGICEDKVSVIQNAIESCRNDRLFLKHREIIRRKYGISERENVLGFVGRLSEEKGLRYLVEAGADLIRSGLPLRIIIIGDGPHRPRIESLVHKKGLQNNVIFTGFQKDVEKFLPSIDIFVLPSLTEGSPMALLEAMSFGIPVVATRVGGVPKVIENGVNGILINPADSIAIAENLKILFHDPSFRKRIAKEAVDVVEKKYNINDWCRKIESQYNHLVHIKQQ